MDGDKLNLIHPSLGLAFTSKFQLDRLKYLLHGNVEIDSLPSGCEGCRETITGELQCCQERDE